MAEHPSVLRKPTRLHLGGRQHVGSSWHTPCQRTESDYLDEWIVRSLVSPVLAVKSPPHTLRSRLGPVEDGPGQPELPRRYPGLRQAARSVFRRPPSPKPRHPTFGDPPSSTDVEQRFSLLRHLGVSQDLFPLSRALHGPGTVSGAPATVFRALAPLICFRLARPAGRRLLPFSPIPPFFPSLALVRPPSAGPVP